jgi:hypothetical protein
MHPLPGCCREVLVMVMRKHQRYFPLYKHQSGGWVGARWAGLRVIEEPLGTAAAAIGAHV